MLNQLPRFPLFACCALLLSATTACGDDDSSEPVEPTLSSIQRHIFDISCNSRSCHAEAGNAGNLILTAGMARGEMLNVDADNEAAAMAGLKLLVPGDVTNSFLYIKLIDPVDEDFGDLMPRTGLSLGQENIDAIAEWIRQGAQDN